MTLSWLADIAGLLTFVIALPGYWALLSEKGRVVMSNRKWIPLLLFVIAILIAGLHLAFLLGFIGRYSPSSGNNEKIWSERPLTQVRDKTFRAQTVPLDGYEYINCDFNEVSFEFKGTAPSRLTNSRIYFDKAGSQIGITSRNPVVSHTLEIVDALNKAAGITDSKLKHE